MAGRNRKLQGLAEAIIKLWEKSLVAKIAIKVGMFTDHAQMALELKVFQFFISSVLSCLMLYMKPQFHDASKLLFYFCRD
jgi:hypothetical protein